MNLVALWRMVAGDKTRGGGVCVWGGVQGHTGQGLRRKISRGWMPRQGLR